jgi:hypothetical protein
LPFHSLASLQIKETAVVFLFRSRALFGSCSAEVWRLIEVEPDAVKDDADDQ